MLMKYSRQRDLILSILRDSDTHPTADMIYDDARRKIPHISKGTVYRNLKLLIENKLISEIKIEGSTARYV